MINFSNTLNRLLTLQSALDSMQHADFFGDSTSHRTGGDPGVNVFKKGDDVVLSTELPGVDKDELTIEVKNRAVRIAGKRDVSYGEGVSLHRAERAQRSFDRTLSLPFEVNPSAIKATYEDGILLIHIPQAEEDKPRKIQVS